MTTIGHLAGGYLVGTALASVMPATAPITPSLVVVATIIGSLFPDIDGIYYAWKVKGIKIEGNGIKHRTYPTHAPLTYAAGLAALLPFLIANPPALALAVAFFGGTLAHFVQDTFGIGPGIMWLWPLRKHFVRIPTVYRRDGSFKKNVFMRPREYMHHWLFFTEFALVLAAVSLAVFLQATLFPVIIAGVALAVTGLLWHDTRQTISASDG